nr:MAG TPA: hypothetical protein [Caudoviricetes sp.]
MQRYCFDQRGADEIGKGIELPGTDQQWRSGEMHGAAME